MRRTRQPFLKASMRQSSQDVKRTANELSRGNSRGNNPRGVSSALESFEPAAPDGLGPRFLFSGASKRRLQTAPPNGASKRRLQRDQPRAVRGNGRNEPYAESDMPLC